MPRDNYKRERERRTRETIQFNHLQWSSSHQKSDGVALDVIKGELVPRSFSCQCGERISVTADDQKNRNIVSCAKCGRRHRASLGSMELLP